VREREERFLVAGFKAFESKILKRGYVARRLKSAVTDEYYSPAGEFWNPKKKSLRLRVYGKNAKIIFCERARGTADKTVLFEGKPGEARRLLKVLGLVKRFTVAKLETVVFTKGKTSFAVERVKGLGWTGEAELHGRGAGALKDLHALGVKTSREPLASLWLKRAAFTRRTGTEKSCRPRRP